MYTIRIFKTQDCTRENVVESNLLPSEFSIFKYLFNRKRLINNDIEVYEDDTLIFVGCVGHFLYRLLEEFRDEIEKEMH